MSAIPPNIAGPILQAAAQAAQTAGVRDSDENRRNETTRVAREASAQRSMSVNDTDQDNEVGEDSASVGGQGRHGGGDEHEEQPSDQDCPESGITRNDDGTVHIDLQA